MSCVTAKQIKVIRGTMQTFCSHLEYDGHGKLHIKTIRAFINKDFGVRKMKDIPQSRFHEALVLIQDLVFYTDKIQIRDRLSERNSLN
ncbi:hypothetical protein QL818_19875, partial [Bacillus altitudinis]|uniref:hypothetical protein n=1 Tax=Bacillus altitudinis TaxID=293387 RepID=UPI0024A991AC